ncbi:Krueppel homolog 2 [Harmonia axyridis]|uniref:Krueppel homolog 2 n=1 Tax=Harmonia axyridis TaxID=115357 RepID=UPI001E276AA6|nr:Krueppel homolog 2 [Harmonia axyridis]
MGDDAASSDTTNRRGANLDALKVHILTHKIDCALWAIRMSIIIFTLGYFIPIFGSSQSAYNKALVANAAVSALRLHQRIPQFQFNRNFFSVLLLEDSCHYLFYSIIFMYDVQPVTLVLMPIALFAILHSASYSLTLLDTLGQNSWWGARLLISLIEFQSLNILRLVAFVEIILMPFSILLILLGRARLMTPFIYYHFLVQRYTSRRNPYTRNMFRELRVLFESTAAKPNLPGVLKSALMTVVAFTSKLAPPVQQAPPAAAQ